MQPKRSIRAAAADPDESLSFGVLVEREELVRLLETLLAQEVGPTSILEVRANALMEISPDDKHPDLMRVRAQVRVRVK